MRELTVSVPAPVRLDTYLQQQFPTLGTGALYRALRENKIKLNGKKQPLSTRVQTGDTVRLYLDEALLALNAGLPAAAAAARYEADVLYEDEALLIANKPAGLPVEGSGDTLTARAARYLWARGRYDSADPPRLCHRLDTGTSGLVLLAKTAEAEAFLTALIRARRLGKRYLCVTLGHPQPPAAVLHGWLRKDAAHGVVCVRSAPFPAAKEIVTGYETLATSGPLALLQVDLVTGRTHQIRAHLASIGCPVLGDSKYGDNAANRARRLKYQALCAWELAFPARIDDERFAYLAGRVFHAPEPWYAKQLREGTLQ